MLFRSQRYVVMIDLGLKSSHRRFFILDLKTGVMESHLTSHGSGSDPNSTGYGQYFSNKQDSHMSSLGIYRTMGTFTSNHGRALRLEGLSSTNSNVYARAIIVHAANYVSDANSTAGRSWGCPALDPKYTQGVIDKIRGGALMNVVDSRKM